MSRFRRYVTIVIQSDRDLASRSYRFPQWVVRAALGGAVILGIGLVLALATYGPTLTAAARLPGLKREVERLERENLKIGELVAALDSAERRYDRIRELLGADVVPDPVRFAAQLPVAPTLRARGPGSSPPQETGRSQPRSWPLDEPGYVTRGQAGNVGAGDTPGEAHPGVDIAVPIGSAVRASGGGSVLQAGEESEYGRFVLLEHPDGYQTLYGHLSRITVRAGQTVVPGEVVGLTGNTGRSSGPHLHFEIRLEGQPVDPRTIIKEPN
jgi:murein DD-endopeptidase MepM/ murein hydrolase activator NlpD